MKSISRRGFIGASSGVATACAVDLSFLLPLSRAAGSDTSIKADEVVFGPEMDRLLRLMRNATREECVRVFAREIKAGLSYRQFVTVLFLAAVENGDPHQVAQVYAAHRISSEARVEERLLPLFWVLNRIKQESEAGAKANSAVKPFKGKLPGADEAAGIFREALLKADAEEAERAALALARDHGARHVMQRLWEFAGRNVGGTLGHTAIAHANSLRALEVMGWQHAEVALRYVTRYIGGNKGDKTYGGNVERVKQNLSRLPLDWASAQGHRIATLEVYRILRSGNASGACDLICAQLVSGKVKAGAAWDAISLAAGDSVARHKDGGAMIGGQIHAVTTTNALRHGFNTVDEPHMRLINLLQAAGVIADFFVGHFTKEGELRDMDLLDLKGSDGRKSGTVNDVFELLPFKGREYVQKNPEERKASDEACRMAFELLGEERNEIAFMRTVRSLLCVKASLDPHDMKYPAAVFEDAHAVSAEWRRYLFASSVHALHGRRSSDSAALVQIREALR